MQTALLNTDASTKSTWTLLKIIAGLRRNRFKCSHTAACMSTELQIVWLSFLCIECVCWRRSAGWNYRHLSADSGDATLNMCKTPCSYLSGIRRENAAQPDFPLRKHTHAPPSHPYSNPTEQTRSTCSSKQPAIAWPVWTECIKRMNECASVCTAIAFYLLYQRVKIWLQMV